MRISSFAAAATMASLLAGTAWADDADAPPSEPTAAPSGSAATPPPAAGSAAFAPGAPTTLADDAPPPAGTIRPPAPSLADVTPTRQAHDATREKSIGSRLEWRWPKFQLYQLGITAGQGALAVGSVAIPGGPRWTGTNPMDEAVRNALRLTDPESSLYARDASDVGLAALINMQFVDTLFVTWWYHDKGSTALQMALIDLQTISFSASINSLIAGAVGRERPYGRSICGKEPEASSSDCQGSNRYRAFFSGHATAAFTLAGLTCAHHINLPLYGGGPVEAVPCAATMVAASAVGILRVASDQHYLSDVLVGAAFGTASGFAIPYLFHYAWDDPEAKPDAAKPTISLVPSGAGLGVVGTF
ncbi:MAG TPA: phosphatase PAP2 family protein [Polyangiaceae bacterium]|jgi:membrane-associated phospholipid phosphatase|nr:phosphatase PAP2 family protein [Polyangiaceae bacterium]